MEGCSTKGIGIDRCPMQEALRTYTQHTYQGCTDIKEASSLHIQDGPENGKHTCRPPCKVQGLPARCRGCMKRRASGMRSQAQTRGVYR